MTRVTTSKRQAQVLTFIKQSAARNGYPPSVREIAGFLGVSLNAAVGHLHGLQTKGYIKVTPRVARGIKVVG